jgi:hypothetical protein
MAFFSGPVMAMTQIACSKLQTPKMPIAIVRWMNKLAGCGEGDDDSNAFANIAMIAKKIVLRAFSKKTKFLATYSPKHPKVRKGNQINFPPKARLKRRRFDGLESCSN